VTRRSEFAKKEEVRAFSEFFHLARSEQLRKSYLGRGENLTKKT
jgi:hypothetical protein